jgi:hypothetical protein
MTRIEAWLFEELRDLWSPLVPAGVDADVEAIADRLVAVLRDLGWTAGALGPARSAAAALAAAADAIEAAAGDDPLAAASAIGSVVRDVSGALSTALPDGEAAKQLLLDLTSELVGGWLARRHRALQLTLRILGIVRSEPAAAVHTSAADPSSPVLRPASSRVVLDVDHLEAWLREPGRTFNDTFLGGTTVTAEDVWGQLGPILAGVLAEAGVPALWGVPVQAPGSAAPVLWIFSSEDLAAPGRAGSRFWCGITVQQDAASDNRPRLNIVPVGELAVARTRGIWSLQAALGLTTPVSIGTDGARLGGAAGANASLAVSGGTSSEPALRLGAAGGPSLVLARVGVTGSLLFRADTPPVPEIALTLQGLQLAMGGRGLDGFLSSQVPDTQAGAATADVTISWSGRDGLKFAASGGFEATLAQRVDLGPVTLRDIRLLVSLAGSALSAAATFDVGLAIGPISAAAEGLGIGVELALEGSGSAPGLIVGPRGPNGIGLSIRAGEVGGGGYLFVDERLGLYAGAAQLSFKALSFTAVGLITTRAADGSPGWSMLLIVTAEFPPIPLGFGFTLNGLGGLLGINRRMDTKEMAAGVRTGGLDSVLFPRDPVHRAKEVVADIGRFFPAAENRFTLGVLVKVAWGPGGLLQIEVGLILELPSPLKLVVIGRLLAELPDREHAVAVLRLDVLGVLDFGRGEVSVDATLRDSRVGPFAISGDMALRGSWGAEAGFAQSAGGFHPAFEPPPGFPPLRRLAIALATSENPRLRLESYLALTPNTIQTGARFEIYAAVTILGRVLAAEGHLGFDALVTLVPFSFTVTVDAGVAITLDGTPILQARLVLTLSGPEPWHVVGYASISLFLIGEVRVQIDRTFGIEQIILPPEINLLERLIDALRQPTAITTFPPPTLGPVALRATSDPGTRILHPAGRVRITQREIPLGKRIERFGAAVPTQSGVFDFTGVALADQPLVSEPVEEFFAPGPFEADLPDDEQLRRPAFDSMRSGVVQQQPSGGVLPAGDPLPLPQGLDETVLTGGPPSNLVPPLLPADGGASRFRPDGFSVPDTLVDAWALAAVTAPFVEAAPMPFAVVPERHVVATLDSLSPMPLGDHGAVTPTSAWEAFDRLSDEESGQVVRAYEAVV